MTSHPSGWTREKPKEPGWYWWRPEDNGLNPLMCWVSSDGIAMFVNFAPSTVRDMDGEFLGPITPEQYIEWAEGKERGDELYKGVNCIAESQGEAISQ